jgi:predicted DNA-binding protein (MmcQ/YjbR family)
MTRNELLTYCRNEYNAISDHPFKRLPDATAIRHANNRKWFGLVFQVPAAKLELPGTANIELLNLKIAPELNSLLQTQPGFLPAYHMSKEHWLSVQLAQFDRVADLADLIEQSFQATQ